MKHAARSAHARLDEGTDTPPWRPHGEQGASALPRYRRGVQGTGTLPREPAVRGPVRTPKTPACVSPGRRALNFHDHFDFSRFPLMWRVG